MKKICIKNLRSLRDTQDIEIKPLTVLVGRNSSGKSTFLRTFPLLKQTFETRTSEPILWYGRYVDFGDFDESVNALSDKKSIMFSFEFNVHSRYLDETFTRRFYNSPNSVFNNEYSIRLSIRLGKSNVQNVIIDFEDHRIEMSFQNRETITSLSINNKKFDISNLKLDYLYSTNSTTLIPSLIIKDNDFNRFSCEKFFREHLFDKLKALSHKSTKDETIQAFIEQIWLGNSETILYSLQNTNKALPEILLKNLSELYISSECFIDIKNLIIGKYLNNIIDLCNRYLEINFLTVKYIAPLRASAERYYRIQGLSIDEIDTRGENIPMLLNNMREQDKKSFQNWVYNNFGFFISTSSKSGHTSLTIDDGSIEEEINLADTGFGYSQILPIIILLWQSINMRYFRSNNLLSRKIRTLTEYRDKHTIVIEQPELHLHPALQAKLIDTFVKIIKLSRERSIDIKIIFETHSETMINRLGYLIAKDQLNADLVNVVIFDKVDNMGTNVTSTTFSEKGYLRNWPIGFFSPEGL